ncbi:PREDICTED: uncharacterized protein LOC104709529 [Camelina sativa]|uniref:Uncharacterized protein LOC104709529 n=1 Tax=Camelina sativa TaxID=90675 RepID=A0ABM0TCY5_CAMSA|nr:PREDICTED: uncharacterized protein LOC104709529 [Camelina sativa]
MAAVVFALKIWRSYLYDGKRRWIELVADSDLDIAYHLGKANLVAEALSRKQATSAQEQDMESLVSEIRTLRLCAISQEPLGLEEVDRADLLSRVQLAQDIDVGLVNVSKAEGSEYQVSTNGTILVHGQVCVPKDEGLR